MKSETKSAKEERRAQEREWRQQLAKPTKPWRDDELARKAKVEAGETVAANLKRDKNLILWAQLSGIAVYIGPRCDNWPQSKYASPWFVGFNGDRDTLCDAYRDKHLPAHPEILASLGELKGRVLLCWCKPKRCHGDTLAELADGLR